MPARPLCIVFFNLNGIRAAEHRDALVKELERPLGYEASWAFPSRIGL